jgi:hypothetical protein
VEADTHASRFDDLARHVSIASTRRRLLRVLAGVPLVGLLTARLEETEARRRRRQVDRRARGDEDKGRGDDRVHAGKGKDTNKEGKKTRCAKAGQKAKKGKRCCQGLVKDGTGRCASRPTPDRSACATNCSGCCAGATCITRRTNAVCGAGGQPCAACTLPQTCGGGTVPGVCGCTPMSTCPSNACGTIGNGCGTGTLVCGDCTLPDTCGGDPARPNVCGCTPAACPSDFCGNFDNLCGDMISCSCKNPKPICMGGNTCAPCANSAQCGPNHLCIDGSCFACDVCDGPNPCQSTVQGAIDQAQIGGTIYICPGTYDETIVITKKLTLIGAGAEDTILSAGGMGRVVTIAREIDVHLEGLTITGGDARVDPDPADGGGIRNDAGTLSITDCVVLKNHAARGGGIFNLDGIVSIENSEVKGNVADLSGGGIHNGFGTVTLGSGAIVTDNDAANPPGGGTGGGIFNDLGRVTGATESSVTLNRPDDCIDFGDACGCEAACP